MPFNLNALKNDVKKITTELGIEKYDIYGSTKEENSASAKNGKSFLLNSSERASLIVRVWNHANQTGVTQTSNLTSEGMKTAFELAQSSSYFSSKENLYDFSDQCLKDINTSMVKSLSEQSVSMQDISQKAIEAEKLILSAGSEFKSVPYNKVSESLVTRFYFNSIGADKIEKTTPAYCYFYPLVQETDKRSRQAGEVLLAETYRNLSVHKCAETAVKKAKKFLKYKEIKSGKYSIIFSPEAFLELLGAFSNFYNAQNIIDNKSLCTLESLNSKIFSDKFSFSDSPQHKDNPAQILFDEEGTPTQETKIVSAGVLSNLLHSSFTAKQLDTKTTGNAHIGSKVTVSAHFLHVKKGEASNKENEYLINIFSELDALTEKIDSTKLNNILSNKNIVYIDNVKSLHAGVNALQGSFSLPFDGFFIDNNQVVSVESATVAGDYFDLLKNIVYVGEEEILTSSGVSPHVMISELSITGE